MPTLLQNSDEPIDGDGAPDLNAHRVFAGAVKGFEAQRLLEAQVAGGGVQGIGGRLEFDAKGIVGVEVGGLPKCGLMKGLGLLHFK